MSSKRSGSAQHYAQSLDNAAIYKSLISTTIKQNVSNIYYSGYNALTTTERKKTEQYFPFYFDAMRSVAMAGTMSMAMAHIPIYRHFHQFQAIILIIIVKTSECVLCAHLDECL